MMLVKLLCRFLLVASCYLAVVAAEDFAHNQNNRILYNRRANSAPASSFSKAFPPFGPDILKGYQSCNSFKSDLVKYLSSSGENYIKSSTNYTCYFNDTVTYYNSSSASPYYQRARRTLKKETSYETNNQVANVQEKESIQSDGKYIYAAMGDRILVCDLNGNVVVNLTVSSSLPTSVNHTSYDYLDSIFIKNNMLTALVSTSICDVFFSNCNSTYSAFYYNFNQKTKTMTLVNQYDISSIFNSVDARQIGDYTYLLASVYFSDLYWALDRCNEDFKDLSVDEYEAAALAYLNSNVNQYVSDILSKLSKEGATSTCNNIIKMFNETIPQYDVSITVTKVFSMDSSGTSETAYFFPITHYYSHFSKNAILVATQGNSDDTFIMKFSLKDLVITPTSVFSFDGRMHRIDLYNKYYRIASSSYLTGEAQVTVLMEQNYQLQVVGRVTVGAGSVDSVLFYNEKCFVVTTKWIGSYYSESSTKMILVNLTYPTNPTIAATEDLNSPLYSMHPIENGKYIISIDNTISKPNASGVTVSLFQATNRSLKQVGIPSEVIVADPVNGWVISETTWDLHAFRYLSQSRKLIIPVTEYDYRYYNLGDGGDNFQGFFVYDVDPVKGIKFIGNVTHANANCSSFPSRSMVFNGDLITSMGATIKRTSSVTTLSNLKWELENYCE
jgi:hypothetical protein